MKTTDRNFVDTIDIMNKYLRVRIRKQKRFSVITRMITSISSEAKKSLMDIGKRITRS